VPHLASAGAPSGDQSGDPSGGPSGLGLVTGAQSRTGALNPADLGRINRARVIHALQVSGPLSRSELATRLQISRGSVSTIVAPLLDSALLVELPKVTGSNGKPPRPLWFADRWRLGAVFVGTGTFTVANVSLDGRLLESSTDTFTDVATFRRRLLRHGERLFDVEALLGIGVGSAGAVDIPTGTVLENYRYPALNHLPLAPLLTEKFGVPTFVDHHPRVQAIGDLWFGIGRELQYFASVYTGDVLGVGLVAGGRVLAGPRGAGGELGHMVVAEGGSQCVCGQRGCWYTIASLGWLRRRAAELDLPGAAEVTCHDLGPVTDGPARRLREEYAANLATGLANLEQILGYGTYVLHGDAAGGGEEFADLVAEQVADRIPRRRAEVSVLAAPEQDEATILGAAGMVMFRRYDVQL